MLRKNFSQNNLDRYGYLTGGKKFIRHVHRAVALLNSPDISPLSPSSTDWRADRQTFREMSGDTGFKGYAEAVHPLYNTVALVATQLRYETVQNTADLKHNTIVLYNTSTPNS